MTDVIGTAEVEVRARLDRLDAGLDEARRKTENAARNMDAGLGRIGGTGSPLHRNLARMQTGFSQARERAQAFAMTATRAATAVGIASAAISAAARPALDYADKLDKMAVSTGVSVERLQSFRFAADQTGAGADFVSQGLERLNRRLGEFVTTGAGPAKAALEQLGIEQEIATGKIEAGEPALDAILERLDSVEGNAEKAAIAAKLFGDEAGPRMVRLLSAGRDGVAALERQFTDLGVTIDTKTVTALVGIRDEITALGTKFRGEFMVFMAEGIVAVTDFAKAIGLINQQFGLAGEARIAGIDAEIARTERLIARFEKVGEYTSAIPGIGKIDEFAVRNHRARIVDLQAERAALERQVAAGGDPGEIAITPTAYTPDPGGSTIADTEQERARLLDDLATSERSIERNKAIYQQFIGLLKEPLPELSEIDLKISADRAAQEIEEAFLSAPEGLQDLAMDAVKSRQLKDAAVDKVKALSQALDEQDRDAARAIEERRQQERREQEKEQRETERANQERARDAVRAAEERAQEETRLAEEASRRQERARQDTARALDALLPKYERLRKGAEDWRDTQLAAFDPSMVEDRARVEEAYQGKLADIARQRADEEEKIRDRQRQADERQVAEAARNAEQAARERERIDKEAISRSEAARRTAAQDRLKRAELDAEIARAAATRQAADEAGGAGSLAELERINATLADRLMIIDREAAAQRAIARLVQENVNATDEEIASARQLAETAFDRERGEREANTAIQERQTLLEREKRLDEERRDAQQRYQDEVRAANDRIIEGFSRTIMQAESFEDALRQIGIQLLEIAANSFFQGAAGQTQPGAAGGVVGQIFGGLGASIFGSINPFGAFALGGAFDSAGLITAFANGGIVDNPTLFGYGGGRSGIMGEAGPEAIMPLRRGPDGKLGVAGGGGGDSHVTVNIQTRDADSFQRSRTQVAATLARAVDRGRRNL